ncbi:uroporphyrinogen-III synthase [Rheinheimera marina]|uniref:Uroporphyrinogen-III synthase n=1 Tax=Rheinheimera marina TaxID=1774958 RepID=A0ABV9JRY2_9GAMM
MTVASDWPVLITRPAGKADQLLASLDEMQLPYLYQPLITTQMVPLSGKAPSLLQQADGIIFVSVSAVSCLQQQVDCRELTAPLYAVGSTTGSLLQKCAGREVLFPQDQRSEGLLALPALQDVAGKHLVVVRGNAGRELIKRGLLERGAKVSYLQSYKRVPLPLDGQSLLDQWRQQQIQCIVVTSNEILQLLFQLISAEGHSWLWSRQWIMVSPRMRDAALELGIPEQCIFLSANANDQALLDSICQLRGSRHV